MTTEQLVKGLRYCSAVAMCDDCCLKTIQKEFGAPFCDDKLKQEAADVIERQAAGIEELREKVPEWIPVTKRLPELEQRVLILDKHGNAMVRTLRRFASEKEPSFRPDGLLPKVHITHWMPLPERPKGGNDGTINI